MSTRIAILDNHLAFAEAIGVALDELDDIESAGSATSLTGFLELCRERDPDVALIDYWLHDGTALDCAALLRDNGIVCRLVLISANPTLVIHRRALDAGFEKVLSKHLALQAIANEIRTPGPSRYTSSVESVKLIDFSPRQQEVLELMGRGVDTRSIADLLFISIHTARGHVKSVLRLLEVPNQLAAVTRAIHEGYLLPHSSAERPTHV